jgi:hypothetical protein
MSPNPYKASCGQEADYSLRETGIQFFARPRVHLWPADSLCLSAATRFRDQQRSCTTHVSRFRPPAVSGGYTRRLSWRPRETRLCPGAVPVNAAGSACAHTVQFVSGLGQGQDRQPG